MVYKAVISAIEGDKFRVSIGGRVSGPLPRLTLLKAEAAEGLEELVVGDVVAVVIFGRSLADGLVLGKVAMG